MTHQEKRLLKIALLIFVVFAAFQLIPTAYQWGQNYLQHIQKLRDDIENAKKLQAKTQVWMDENQRAKQKLSEVNAGLLEGNNSQLVGANMQKLLRELARQTGINLTSMDPPKTETTRTNQWMLVIQTMQFEADSKSLMAFLKALDKAPKKLIIAMIDIRSNRERLSGSIQVTGFSRFTESNPQ
jgi:predicted PurR-regulated permease PerM